MIDYHKQLVSALGSILPTHYEMALTSKTKTPCISYLELSNIEETAVVGASIGYSRIIYQVKVWANDLGQIQQYSKEVDKKLKALGFKRISSGELYDSNSTLIQKIFSYEALAYEEFNN